MTSSSIIEPILNHLKMNTTGALLLTGDWGSGKTYHVKKVIFPLIESQKEFRPLIISLYGESDKNSIAQKILFAYLDNKGQDMKLNTGNIARNLKTFSDGLPFLKKYVDIDKLILGGTAENALKLIPTDKIFICFDDIERMSSKIPIEDFLGLINDLVENTGCKVMLIANEIEIGTGIVYKEKTVEKTIQYVPNMSDVFDNLLANYNNTAFKKFLEDNKEFFMQTLTANTENKEINVELKKLFSNIRTLKFSLEHFKVCFDLLIEDENITEIELNKLKNLWAFTLSISIEFRKHNNISFLNRKKLDMQVSAISNLNIQTLLSSTQIDLPAEENEWSYSENFKTLYYNRLSMLYIFHEELYDLITGGKKINKEDFIANTNERFVIKEGKVNRAHEILTTIMTQGYWSYSDSEFPVILDELLEHCAKGDLEDLVSYLNASVYLYNFNDIIKIDKSKILEKFKLGLDVFFTRKAITNYAIKQFNLVQGQFETEDDFSIVLRDYIKTKIEQQKNINQENLVNELNNLFENDLLSFIKKFLPEDQSLSYPSDPVFHKLSKNTIEKGIKNANPTSLMSLVSLLKFRYLKTSFAKKLVEEIVFLNHIGETIKQIDFSENTLSKYIMKKDLSTTIEQVRHLLNSYQATT